MSKRIRSKNPPKGNRLGDFNPDAKKELLKKSDMDRLWEQFGRNSRYIGHEDFAKVDERKARRRRERAEK